MAVELELSQHGIGRAVTKRSHLSATLETPMIPSFVLRIVVLLLLILPVRGESPALMLERAHQKEVLTELAPAIALYRRVASNPVHALRWRAQATMGLARCHEQMESYVTANSHYLNVMKEFGQFKELADAASERILAISRILAQDGGLVSGEDYLYLNDLVLSLYGAYRNNDRELESEVFSELDEHLTRLAKAVAGTGEDELIGQSRKELAKVKESAVSDFAAAAKRLARTENLGLFIETGYEDDPGELFNPVLRWKDRLQYFLTEGNVVKATRFAERIKEYLAPLIDTPASDDQKLALHMSKQSEEIRKALEKEELSVARRALYRGDKKRHDGQLSMAVYLEGFEYLPVSHLPFISASADWVEHAITFLDTDPEKAKKSVQKALKMSVELQKLVEIPDFKKENAGFVDDLKKVIEAMEKGQTEKAREMLEGDEELN